MKNAEQKIQLVICINLVHMINKDRIKFYVKSDNIECLPSDNTDEVLDELITSLRKSYDEEILFCRTSSNYAYESIENLDMHFNKIDLSRASSFLPTYEWIRNKKCTINPQNKNGIYWFKYSIAISLYHRELGSNPERINKRIEEFTSRFN